MAFLKLGLVLGAVTGAFVVGGALDQGFPIEVALLRGAAACMVVSFAGYLGELIVVTAPPRMRAAPPRRFEDEPDEERDTSSPVPFQLGSGVPGTPTGAAGNGGAGDRGDAGAVGAMGAANAANEMNDMSDDDSRAGTRQAA